MPHTEPNHPHHQDAATHHELAAKSHLKAAKLYESGKFDASARHAMIAHGHTLHALHHSNEAIKVRTEKPTPAKKA